MSVGNLLQVCPALGLVWPLLPGLCPCPSQMSSETPFLFLTICCGECTFLWGESWRAAGSQAPVSRGEERAPTHQGREAETHQRFFLYSYHFNGGVVQALRP